MAATYGTRIGSSASGAFAIYPVATTGADVINILNADSVTGAVTVATGGAPLSVLELSALSTLLKELIAAQAIVGNVLSYYRKLVGVVGLTNGATVALSVANVAGNVWTLRATASGAGEFLVYVPSSVACGLYTGSGADADPSVVPTTQRYDAVANVPGLYLAGAVALAVPVAVGAPTVTLSSTLSAGYAEVDATAVSLFRVEKIDMGVADPGPGAGTLLFDLQFAASGLGGNQTATVTSIAGDLTVPAGWLYRVVNPAAGDATLADVALTVAGSIAL